MSLQLHKSKRTLGSSFPQTLETTESGKLFHNQKAELVVGIHCIVKPIKKKL